MLYAVDGEYSKIRRLKDPHTSTVYPLYVSWVNQYQYPFKDPGISTTKVFLKTKDALLVSRNRLEHNLLGQDKHYLQYNMGLRCLVFNLYSNMCFLQNSSKINSALGYTSLNEYDITQLLSNL